MSKASRGRVTKGGKRRAHGGIATGASFPVDVQAWRRNRIAEITTWPRSEACNSGDCATCDRDYCKHGCHAASPSPGSGTTADAR